jgi:hypothetical protein
MDTATNRPVQDDDMTMMMLGKHGIIATKPDDPDRLEAILRGASGLNPIGPHVPCEETL